MEPDRDDDGLLVAAADDPDAFAACTCAASSPTSVAASATPSWPPSRPTGALSGGASSPSRGARPSSSPAR
jgi:hypothetical protein